MFWIILALFVVGGFLYACKYDDYHNNFVKPKDQREFTRFGLARNCTFKNNYNNHNGRRPGNSAHGFDDVTEYDRPDPDFEEFTEDEIDYDFMLRDQEEQAEEDYYIAHMHDE